MILHKTTMKTFVTCEFAQSKAVIKAVSKVVSKAVDKVVRL